jgi:hypothetical protein
VANAHTFLRRWDSFSRPVALKCDNDREYVVKGRCTDRQVERALVNEQVVGYLAQMLGAPVPPIDQVNVPQELVSAEPRMQHLRPGVAHAIHFVPDCSDRSGLDHTTVPENRPRFASLAILFGWMGGGDQQLIYSNNPPRLVHSVDHGHFFAGGPDWTPAGLAAAEDEAVQPHPYFAGCFLGEADLREPLRRLALMNLSVIAAAVALPPDEWQIDLAARVSLAVYLGKRRDTLLRLHREEDAHD